MRRLRSPSVAAVSLLPIRVTVSPWAGKAAWTAAGGRKRGLGVRTDPYCSWDSKAALGDVRQCWEDRPLSRPRS